MSSEKRKSLWDSPWSLPVNVIGMTVVLAALAVYAAILYTLQFILFPVMILEIFIEYKNKVINLPDSSIRKKLMRLLYALYYAPFK